MKNFFKQFVFISFLTMLLTLPFFALAQISSGSITEKLKTTGGQAGFDSATDEYTLSSTIGSIVNTAISLLGIIFIVLIIIGGYQWMTAGGNDEQVKKAQNRIKNSVIGLIIVISAWSIYSFVLHNIIFRAIE